MKQEYKKYYEQFGLNVVYYRKRKRLTQMKLAEMVEIDRSHISAIELGNVGVSFDVVFKLCEVLGITPKHSYATLLNDAGASVKTIQAIIGHSYVQTTINRYVHSREDKKQEAVRSVNEMLAVQRVEQY